jgi:AcrR family transcriptional regulator
MKKPIDLSLKKQPRQARALATVEAIAEAATYILRDEGPRGFTANKVAERAGVNIASFYQYFPNKEALLFHVAQITWDRQLAQLMPILTRPGPDHAQKLRDFIRAFFVIEAQEADLRQALSIAAIDLRETEQFQAMIARGTALIKAFIQQAVAGRGMGENDMADIDVKIDFIVLLVTSVAERTTDNGTSGQALTAQADLLSDMLIAHFRIA